MPWLLALAAVWWSLAPGGGSERELLARAGLLAGTHDYWRLYIRPQRLALCTGVGCHAHIINGREGTTD